MSNDTTTEEEVPVPTVTFTDHNGLAVTVPADSFSAQSMARASTYTQTDGEPVAIEEWPKLATGGVIEPPAVDERTAEAMVAEALERLKAAEDNATAAEDARIKAAGEADALVDVAADLRTAATEAVQAFEELTASKASAAKVRAAEDAAHAALKAAEVAEQEARAAADAHDAAKAAEDRALEELHAAEGALAEAEAQPVTEAPPPT